MQTVVSRVSMFLSGGRFMVPLLAICSLAAIKPVAATAGTYDSLSDLAARISRARLERNVRELSGAEPITIDGTLTSLTTRYTYSDKKTAAARYLIRELERAGYHPIIQEFELDLTPPDFQGLAISNTHDTVWVGAYDGGIYRATAADGWTSFELAGRVSQEIQKLTIDAGGRLWAACGLIGSSGGALYLSHDGGATWKERARGTEVAHLNDIAFSGAFTGITAGRNGTALRTTNGGASWNPITPGPWTIRGIASSAPLHFWMAGDGGRIYESTNGGDGWNITQPTIVRLFDIDFADERHGVTGGEDIIYTTRDGGSTWNGFPTAEWVWSVAMADSNRIAAAGNNGMLLLSDDGGTTWTELDISLSGGTDLNEAVFMGRDSLWVAGRFEIRLLDLSDVQLPALRLYQVADTLAGYNIIARIPGTDMPDERILLCGHYDSYATDADPMILAPGADDNASGTACILEVARTLSGANLQRTLEFVLFDSEERGLQGSRYFVQNIDTTAVYSAVVNLDMIAHDPLNSRRLTLSGRAGTRDTMLAPFFTDAADSLALSIEPVFITNESPTSDYKSFWPLDSVAVVLCIETDYTANSHANASTDSFNYLDFGYLQEVTKTVFGSVAMLSGFEGSVQLLPAGFAPVVPNPFHEITTITISLPARQVIDLTVFDVTGRFVSSIEHGTFGPEILVRTWDGTDSSGRRAASGVYFLRLKAGRTQASRKIVIVR